MDGCVGFSFVVLSISFFFGPIVIKGKEHKDV